MNNCIFCKIIQGLIPSAKIYEDPEFLAFLDIRPANHGHVLVIPKVHAERLTDLPEAILSRELVLAARIAPAILAATGMTDFNLFNTNGAASGQEVFHHHLHIIPRKDDDGMRLSIDPQSYGEGQMAEVAAAIRRHLDSEMPGES